MDDARDDIGVCYAVRAIGRDGELVTQFCPAARTA